MHEDGPAFAKAMAGEGSGGVQGKRVRALTGARRMNIIEQLTALAVVC